MPAAKKPAAARKPPTKQQAAKRVVDLNAARAARQEAAGEPITILIGSDEFTLPTEMPIAFAIYAEQHRVSESVEALLGDDYERFLASRPSLDDFLALVKGAGELYGVAEGDSPASASS